MPQNFIACDREQALPMSGSSPGGPSRWRSPRASARSSAPSLRSPDRRPVRAWVAPARSGRGRRMTSPPSSRLLLDDLARLRPQTDVELASAQLQPSVQRGGGPPLSSPLSVPPRRPPHRSTWRSGLGRGGWLDPRSNTNSSCSAPRRVAGDLRGRAMKDMRQTWRRAAKAVGGQRTWLRIVLSLPSSTPVAPREMTRWRSSNTAETKDPFGGEPSPPSITRRGPRWLRMTLTRLQGYRPRRSRPRPRRVHVIYNAMVRLNHWTNDDTRKVEVAPVRGRLTDGPPRSRSLRL